MQVIIPREHAEALMGSEGRLNQINLKRFGRHVEQPARPMRESPASRRALLDGLIKRPQADAVPVKPSISA